MKCIVFLFALIASSYAGFLDAPYAAAPIAAPVLVKAPVIASAPVLSSVPVVQHVPIPTKIAVPTSVAVPTVQQVVNYVPTTVPAGVSHQAFHVPESRFTRTDWETPGALHAIPAVARYAITQPGYTTYIPTQIQKTSYSSVPVVTKSLASVPIVTKSVVHAPVFAAKTFLAAPHYAPAY